MKQTLRFALRFARRELQSGELMILALALWIAVTAMSSVAFFASRVEGALSEQASRMLAADLVLTGNQRAGDAIRSELARRGVRTADTLEFPSMVMANGQAALANFKAVSAGYPLRGAISVRLADGVHSDRGQPQRGTVWGDARLLDKLHLKPGDMLQVGDTQLRLAGEVLQEPDSVINVFNIAPRLMLNNDDLPATGLIQEGSRIRWRLLIADDSGDIHDLAKWLREHHPKGSRLQGLKEGQPEAGQAIERAQRFLGLTAMLTVALSAAAMALAVRRYLALHWQSVAVLRCLGMTATETLRLFLLLFMLLALVIGVLGSFTGFALQALLLQLAGNLVGTSLPAAGFAGWLAGPLASFVLLLGLTVPPLLAIRQVPPLAVLRAELALPRRHLMVPVLAVLALLLLSAWQIRSAMLIGALAGGLAGFVLAVALLAWGLLYLLRRLPGRRELGWRFGLANLARRPALALLQIVSLTVGLMALLTLTVVRGDLLAAWQESIPPQAPNRFVINIQPEQKAPVADYLVKNSLPTPELQPMVRGRLVEINGKAVEPARYEDEQARRLAEREFNLSWRADLPPGNRLLAGAWWRPDEVAGQFSVEQGLADKLGIRLGDTLAFDIAGSSYQGKVTSLRKLSWDSFRVNFFVIAPQTLLGDKPTSWITCFYLPAGREDIVNRLVAAYPNLTVIDVSAVLSEIRSMIARLTGVIEAMFALALLAGVLVLWAALSATRDARLFDVALLRTLGASRRQIVAVLLAELIWLGALAGVLAGAGALLLGQLAGAKLFELTLPVNWALLPIGMLAGVLVVTLAGWPLLRRVVDASPLAILRTAG